MRHKILPEKKTPEQLAEWIKEHQVDQRENVEEVPLSDEDKAVLKDKIAHSTAKLYDLQDLKKSFEKVLTNGTPWFNDEHQPQDFQIPPTKGTKILEEIRHHADKTLKAGFNVVKTTLYGIPWPEKSAILYVDIEGAEFQQEPMTDDQRESFKAGGGLFSEEEPLAQ